MRHVRAYSELEFIIHKSYVLGLVDINDRALQCVTNMDSAIAVGVLLYFLAVVALIIYSAHRRKKRMLQQPAQQRQPQPPPKSVFRSHQEPEKEDSGVEDSEGDGLMLFDDPMFPPDPDDED
jgi:hypothetical protein